MKRNRPTTLEPISASMILIVALHLAVAFGIWCWWHESGASRRNAQETALIWMKPGDFTSSAPAAPPKTKVLAVAPKSAKATPPDSKPKPSTEPPVQKATLIAPPIQQHQMVAAPNDSGTPLFAPTVPAPKPAANRSITLRRAPEKRANGAYAVPPPPMANPTLMDFARLNAMRPPPVPLPAPGQETGVEEVNLDPIDEAVNRAFLAGWTAPPIDAVPTTQHEARLNISIGKDGSVLKTQMSKFSGSHVLDQSILETAAKVKKISTALPSNFSKDSYDLELNFLLLP